MESKFVSKAKTALHNAAAKAERVLTEIKADLVAELSAHSQGSEGKGELPWAGRTEHEKRLEDECRKRILEISKSPNFLVNEQDGRIDVDMHSARAVLECDENLRNLWFEYIPKRMKEKEFWKRYFTAVKRVKEEILEVELDSGSESVVSSTDLKSGPDTGGEAFETESPTKDLAEEDSYKKALKVVTIPPSTVVRRLAYAIQFAKAFETITDLAAVGVADKDSDWSSLVSGLAVVRKLSLRDKDGKIKAQNKVTGRYHSLLWSLFDADIQYEGKDVSVKEFLLANKSKLPEELHGAPPESFITQLAEIISGIKTEQKMAEFWLEIIKECRHRWRDGQPIPRVPVDANPDLSYCLLLQQLQVINCCIARRKRRVAAIESLNALQDRRADSENSCMLSAKLKDGKLVPRLGVDRQAEDLRMLETGEPIYSPITQDGPVLTEDLIKETEELVLRTGSFGAGCSQLFSDMQAFKAANPGCILEDFVRWYSPLDWRQEPVSGLLEDKDDESSLRGHLSARMKCEGNLWQELWFSARAIPAVAQAPLFDEELAGESTLDALESIAPADFFEQLFTTALSAGFAIAEAAPSAKKDPLKKCLKECRDYILSTCHRHMDSETLEHLCEVYEFMETVLHAPPEELSEVKVLPDAVKPAFKAESKTAIASMHFAELGRLLNKKQVIRDQHCQRTKGDGPVSSVVKFFESKASLFERKSKQGSAEEEKKISPAESDWTIV